MPVNHVAFSSSETALLSFPRAPPTNQFNGEGGSGATHVPIAATDQDVDSLGEATGRRGAQGAGGTTAGSRQVGRLHF